MFATLFNDTQNIRINNYSTNFINTGTIKASSTTGFINNYATIYNNTNGLFGTKSYLTFTNGSSSNYPNAIFYNYGGTLDCDRGIYNYGTIYNGYNGSNWITGSNINGRVNGLNNLGGIIYNYGGNTITTTNNFTNNAVIENYGTFTISYTSDKRVTNSGTIYNSTSTGKFNISNDLTNSGSIYNYESGTITIKTGFTLTSSSGNI
jgi:hypothetical protein